MGSSAPTTRPEPAITALSFRFATADDAPAIVALVESAYRGDDSRRGWTTEADLLGGQRTDEAMVREVIARPGALVILAFRGERLVACCELQGPRTDGPSADAPHGCAPAATRDHAYFGMFAVDPTLQGGGVGRAVLAEAERVAATEWHASALEMTVITLRPELIAWYERRGYARTGAMKPFPYGDDRYGLPTRDDIELAVLEKRLG